MKLCSTHTAYEQYQIQFITCFAFYTRIFQTGMLRLRNLLPYQIALQTGLILMTDHVEIFSVTCEWLQTWICFVVDQGCWTITDIYWIKKNTEEKTSQTANIWCFSVQIFNMIHTWNSREDIQYRMPSMCAFESHRSQRDSKRLHLFNIRPKVAQ